MQNQKIKKKGIFLIYFNIYAIFILISAKVKKFKTL